jgi:integrase
VQGSLVKRGKKGLYSVVLHLREKDPSTGRDKVKWIATGTPSKREAQRVLAHVLAEYNAGAPLPTPRAGSPLLGAFLAQWMESKGKRLRRSTAQSYGSIVRHRLIPNLGRHRLADLTPQLLETYLLAEMDSPRLDRRTAALSPGYVAYEANVLKAACADAVRWGLLLANPMDRVALPRVPRREPQYFTPAQATRFLEEAKATSRYYALYLLAIRGGLRIGEIAALRWPDIDLEGAVVRVRHNLDIRCRPAVLGPTKTGRTRTVDIGQDTAEALRRHKLTQMKTRLALGPGWNDEDWVFTTASGRHIWREELKRADFDPICARLGLPRIRLHDLRHTMATLMLAQGVHPKVVQERLGHSSIAMTMDTYSAVLPGLQREAADLIEAATRPPL